MRVKDLNTEHKKEIERLSNDFKDIEKVKKIMFNSFKCNTQHFGDLIADFIIFDIYKA